VEAAPDGEHALQVYGQVEPDVMMPDARTLKRDGIVLVSELRKRRLQVWILSSADRWTKSLNHGHWKEESQSIQNTKSLPSPSS
jgi:DNA-binding response OmpR family regulator